MRLGRHPVLGRGNHKVERDTGRWRDPENLCRASIAGRLALVILLLSPTATAQAQAERGAPGIIVNYDVLNNLGQAPFITGIQRRAPALLPPPSEAPRSRLLVAPRRPVVAKAPAEPAPPKSPAPVEPALSAIGSAEPAQELAAVQEVLPARLVSDPAPAVEDPSLVVEPPTEIPPPPVPVPPDSAPPDPVESSLEPPPPPAPLLPEVAAAPPPEPPAAASEPAEAPQIVARPPARAVSGPLRLLFEEGSTDLSETAKSELAALSGDLLADNQRRVQLRAYAVGGEQSGRNARRLSLSRALAVRAFLVDKGVSTSQIDVRALGTKFKDGPADRVDVVDVDR